MGCDGEFCEQVSVSGVDVVGDLVQGCLHLGRRRSHFYRSMGVFVLGALSDDFDELYDMNEMEFGRDS